MTVPISNEDTIIRLSEIQSMIECGQHSGFLPCCIRFYVTEKIWMSDARRDRYTARIEKRGNEIGKEWNYIPCRTCLKNGIVVQMKPCPNGITCHPNDGREMANILLFDLKSKLSDLQYGFKIIKEGKVPSAGAVASSLTTNMNRMAELCTALESGKSSITMLFTEQKKLLANIKKNIRPEFK